ncbi:MAG: calcium/sodium antiporter [Myxococcota bacterium]
MAGLALEALLLVLGMGLLIFGGRALVSGASRLAATLGVSEVAIGLTVVAFGTSAPELAVNTLAALRGNSDIAFGNVIGSNIANVGLVLGACAVTRVLVVESVIVSREIPMMLLATAGTIVMGLDRIHGAPADGFDRADGLLLLLLFSIFLYYSVAEVVSKRRADPVAAGAAAQAGGGETSRGGSAVLLALCGLALLMVGAQVTVTNAVSIAESLGVPSVVIGLTLVSLGTSLPELATSLVATSQGRTSLAVGNVVGSNVFNLLFILGTTATIRSVEVPSPHGAGDLGALAAFSAVLLVASRTGGASLGRWHGVGLIAAYGGYVVWRFAG